MDLEPSCHKIYFKASNTVIHYLSPPRLIKTALLLKVSNVLYLLSRCIIYIALLLLTTVLPGAIQDLLRSTALLFIQRRIQGEVKFDIRQALL